MPEKPRRSISRAMSMVSRRRPGTATREMAGRDMAVHSIGAVISLSPYPGLEQALCSALVRRMNPAHLRDEKCSFVFAHPDSLWGADKQR